MRPRGLLVLMLLMCFYKGEMVSGLAKICYYDCVGSLVAITIGSAELCPLTIERRWP